MKIQHLTFFFGLQFSCLIGFCNAQEISRFSLGFSATPIYSIGIITNDGNTPQEIADSYKELEEGRIGFTSNITVAYRFNSKIELGTGICYHNIGIQTKKNDLVFASDPILNFNQIRYRYINHHISVPLEIVIHLNNKLFISGSMNSMFNIFNHIVNVKYQNDKRIERNSEIDQSTVYRFANLNGKLGIGISFFDSKNISLYLLPFGSINIFKISKDASLNRQMLMFGVEFGIKFN